MEARGGGRSGVLVGRGLWGGGGCASARVRGVLGWKGGEGGPD